MPASSEPRTSRGGAYRSFPSPRSPFAQAARDLDRANRVVADEHVAQVTVAVVDVDVRQRADLIRDRDRRAALADVDAAQDDVVIAFDVGDDHPFDPRTRRAPRGVEVDDRDHPGD